MITVAHWLSATLQPCNTLISSTSKEVQLSAATNGWRYTCQFSAIAQAALDKPRGMAKGTLSLDATLTVAQNIGHNSLESLATRISTGVASGPTQLFASALLKIQASHWPGHSSLRGTDDDVSHDCACPNSSAS